MTRLKRSVPALIGTFGILASAHGATITFEDLSLAPESFYNGSDGAGSFTSGGAAFENSFTDAGSFTYWSGFSYSNTTDSVTPGFGNQYSSYAGVGAGGSSIYGVGYYNGEGPVGVDIPLTMNLAGAGAYFSNTTYAGLSMENGDGFAKAFGGPDGTDPDWLLLTITGKFEGEETGSVDFYLADFRSSNPAEDYIVDDWRFADLSALGEVDRLEFSMDSTDKSGGFLNTPAYFGIDNIGAVPEPSVGVLALSSALFFFGVRRRS